MDEPPCTHDVVAAIDFGATKIDVAVARTDGTLLHRTRLPTDAARGAEQAVRRALDTTRHVIAQGTAGGGVCRAAGVVSPGVVLDDRILFAPNVPGWERLALADAVRAGLEIEAVVVGGDVKAATVAEARWGALHEADPGVFLGLGTGIAAGIVISGRVLDGFHKAAGEIGYNLLGRDQTLADTPSVATGSSPLEEFAGGHGLGIRASELTGTRMSAEQAFASPDPRVRTLVDDAIDTLGRHLAQLAILLDPQRIAIGGGLVGSIARIRPVLHAWLHHAVPVPPELVTARFAHDAALHGAVALAVDALDGPVRAVRTSRDVRPAGQTGVRG